MGVFGVDVGGVGWRRSVLMLLVDVGVGVGADVVGLVGVFGVDVNVGGVGVGVGAVGIGSGAIAVAWTEQCCCTRTISLQGLACCNIRFCSFRYQHSHSRDRLGSDVCCPSPNLASQEQSSGLFTLVVVGYCLGVALVCERLNLSHEVGTRAAARGARIAWF